MTLEAGYKIFESIINKCDKIKFGLQDNINKNYLIKEQNELINLINLAKEFHESFEYLGANLVNTIMPMEQIKKNVLSVKYEIKRLT